MAKVDIELFMNNLGTYLQASLNTQITAVVTDKGNDGIIPKAIPTGAFFFQTMNNAEAVFDPYCFYGVVDISVDARTGAAAKRYAVHVMIVASDEGDPQLPIKMFRYLRALEELFTGSNFQAVAGGLRIVVHSSVPIPLSDLNTGNSYRAVGVALDVTIP